MVLLIDTHLPLHSLSQQMLLTSSPASVLNDEIRGRGFVKVTFTVSLAFIVHVVNA